MPKKPFSFKVTGRKLLPAEKDAVDAFVDKYLSITTAAVAPLNRRTRRPAVVQNAVVVPDVIQRRPTSSPKGVKLMEKTEPARKVGAGVGKLTVAARKSVIFGIAPASKAKPTPVVAQKPVAPATGGIKPASAKRGVARGVQA